MAEMALRELQLVSLKEALELVVHTPTGIGG
jgi:hypothetical protein